MAEIMVERENEMRETTEKRKEKNRGGRLVFLPILNPILFILRP